MAGILVAGLVAGTFVYVAQRYDTSVLRDYESSSVRMREPLDWHELATCPDLAYMTANGQVPSWKKVQNVILNSSAMDYHVAPRAGPLPLYIGNDYEKFYDPIQYNY